MNKTLFLLLAFLLPIAVWGQSLVPTAAPVMKIVAADGTTSEESSYEGSAPLHVRFEAHPENQGARTPLYEWRFLKDGDSAPFLLRYDENTEYTFAQSGSFTVQLLASFVLGKDTVSYEMDTPFRIVITESKLELPNAFTPNGDGTNDVFRAKEGYRSLVEFKAMVFNRWGKKVAEWSDPADGWDGRTGGSDAPDGAYYLVVKARGADGVRYDIKKTINLLRKSIGTGGS